MNERRVRVLIAHPLAGRLVEQLQRLSPALSIQGYKTCQVSEIPIEIWQECEVLYTEHVLPPPERVPNLKWIQFHYAGIDYALDAPVLRKPGLQVTTLSGVSSLPMGEYVLMMLLSFGHRMGEMRAYQDRATWPVNRFECLAPKEIRKSTVGLIGYGSAGRQVARLLKAFGAKVIVAKRDPTDLVDHGYYQEGMGDPDGRCVDQVYPVERIQEMLPQCDFVVVAVPLTPSTRNLIGRTELYAMKKGAYLVDISRGGVVDHRELVEVIRSRQLAGAALDVFPVEPLPQDDPIWNCPQVVITPHLAGYSPFYLEDAVRLFSENLIRYMSGRPLLNSFHFEKGY